MDPKEAAIMAARKQSQIRNERTGAYFAGAMLGLIAICTASHWISLLAHEYSLRDGNGLVKHGLQMTRRVRSVLMRKLPFYPSLGYTFIHVLYLAINVVLCFHDLKWNSLFDFGKRLGWMSTYNIALVTFLAMRNTPLAPLTAYSYERLNCLHQMAGYCTIAFALMHGVVFVAALSREDSLPDLLEDANIMGIVAGLSMLIILVSVFVLLRRLYEMFYVVHIILFMLILITVGMHRPEMDLKTLYVIIFAASVWVSDRTVRFSRFAWHAFGNNASITPLDRGGVRIVVRRTPRQAVPGSHVFVWMPKIRLAETHPFTVVSTNPLELVVSAHNGFTKDLFAHASKRSMTNLRVSIDGPYGTLPDFLSFDQIIFIAGGSGASFTFGVATDLVNKLRNWYKRPIVNFIWVVRQPESLTWYARELDILRESTGVELRIHVTRSVEAESTTTALETVPNTVVPDDEKFLNEVISFQGPSFGGDPASDSDVEISEQNGPKNSNTLRMEPEVHAGRPDIASLIPYMVDRTESYERTIVAVCGPQSLISTTRSTVASIVARGDRSLGLHCEQFGW